jgi:hypothetical protein
MILGFSDIGPDMQSAVGVRYVIFLTDCAAHRNSFVPAVRVTYTKACWCNKMIVAFWIFQRVWSVARHIQHSSMTAANGADPRSWLEWDRHIKAANEHRLWQQAVFLTFPLGGTHRTDTLLLLLEAYEHHSSYPWSCSVRRTGTVRCVDCSVGKEGARFFTYY